MKQILFAFVLASLVGCGSEGRYQIVADGPGLVHRLDTMTGELELFVVGPETAKIESRGRYWSVAKSK